MKNTETESGLKSFMLAKPKTKIAAETTNNCRAYDAIEWAVAAANKGRLCCFDYLHAASSLVMISPILWTEKEIYRAALECIEALYSNGFTRPQAIAAYHASRRL